MVGQKLGPMKGVSVSSVYLKFSAMSGVDLAVRASSVGLSGVSVSADIGFGLNVSVGWGK